MKMTVIAIIMTAFLLPATSFAAHHGERGGHGKHMDRMATELQLTDEQREQLKTVKQEQRSKHQVLRQETKTRIDAILNDEQRARMETLRAERKQRWMERREQHKDRKSGNQ